MKDKATLSIDAVRKPIFELFYRVFSTHTDVEYSDNTDDAITQYYTIAEVPNGYRQTEDAFFSELSSYIVWKNNTGSQIKLQQLLTDASTVFDSENGKVEEGFVGYLEIPENDTPCFTADTRQGVAIGYIAKPTEKSA